MGVWGLRRARACDDRWLGRRHCAAGEDKDEAATCRRAGCGVRPGGLGATVGREAVAGRARKLWEVGRGVLGAAGRSRERFSAIMDSREPPTPGGKPEGCGSCCSQGQAPGNRATQG